MVFAIIDNAINAKNTIMINAISISCKCEKCKKCDKWKCEKCEKIIVINQKSINAKNWDKCGKFDGKV